MDVTFEDLLPHEQITLRTYSIRLQEKETFGLNDLTLFNMVQDILAKYPELSMYDVPLD
jgi:hypothetical protein